MNEKLRILLLIILFAIFTNTLNAQISIGIQGGLNSAILKLSNKAPEATLSYNNGIVLGTIINYEINKMFSLQSEPRYIQKEKEPNLILVVSKPIVKYIMTT